MATRYTTPSVESILEDEDEPREELRANDPDSADDGHRPSRPGHDLAMKANTGRERERPRRHKSRSKHAAKGKSKNIGVKRASGSSRDNDYEESRLRHRRGGHSNRSSSSTSSSDEEELVEDHRAVLAARSRLTSPSMVSTSTTQTTATNKSSSSSGSNSTVTQASITKRSSLGKRPEVEEAEEPPMSPAVPDPPNVFEFLDKDGSPEPEEEQAEEEDGEEEEEEEEEEESDEDEDEAPQWPPHREENDYVESAPPQPKDVISASSSASSSFHGEDNFSEPAVDGDTDRSSSPEQSERGLDETPNAPPPTDQASAKIASQIAAAQQRQNIHGSMQQFGTPNMPRGNTQLPHIPSSALSARYQYHMQQRPLPRAEKLPVTGYELLASRLSAFSSSDSEKGTRIKPMYRKFEALNHRLLLHLQDELSELEEQLHRLDHADTQSRRIDQHGYIIPASRRLAAQAGGELQWHKTDVLGKIGYKLAQYNQALSSFNSTQSLGHPGLEDIEHYRSYLQTEQPIAEAETHFLDPTDDLVSIYSENLTTQTSPHPYLHSSHASSTVSSEVSSHTSHTSVSTTPSPSPPLSPPHPELQPILPGLASAIAIAVLVPILTFSIIPGFVGRMTVALLVAFFMFGALVQSGIVRREVLWGQEVLSCAGIYLGVMVVVAGIVR